MDIQTLVILNVMLGAPAMLILFLGVVLLIQRMAQENFIFTITPEMHSKAIMRFGGLKKILTQKANPAISPSRFQRFFGGGLRVIGWPFIDAVYKFKWPETCFTGKNGSLAIEEKFIDKENLSLKEQVMKCHPINIFSKDNIMVAVLIAVFVKVEDPEKVLFRAEDWFEVLKNRLEPFIRTTIAKFEIDKLLKEGKKLNALIQDALHLGSAGDELVDIKNNYGLNVGKVEFLTILPVKLDIIEALGKPLKANMEAERIKKVYSAIKEYGIDIKRLETLEKIGGKGTFILSAPELANLFKGGAS